MEAATPALGQAVDVTYHALYIVLSYFVSIVGSLTTLELLHRRTSSHGCYNWLVALPSNLDLVLGDSNHLHVQGICSLRPLRQWELSPYGRCTTSETALLS